MKPTKHEQRLKRGHRVRQQIGAGTAAKPRFVVFRSNTAVSAQIINDIDGKTLVAASSQKVKVGSNID
ncbi:MAG: 50S ribosomal protein L18, partial [Crocinitomicaceae bacterium]